MCEEMNIGQDSVMKPPGEPPWIRDQKCLEDEIKGLKTKDGERVDTGRLAFEQPEAPKQGAEITAMWRICLEAITVWSLPPWRSMKKTSTLLVVLASDKRGESMC